MIAVKLLNDQGSADFLVLCFQWIAFGAVGVHVVLNVEMAPELGRLVKQLEWRVAPVQDHHLTSA